jgi:hypothetical protein
MWQFSWNSILRFDWSIFWAILAAFVVRGLWVGFWDQTLGKYSPTLWSRLVVISDQLEALIERLAENQSSAGRD